MNEQWDAGGTRGQRLPTALLLLGPVLLAVLVYSGSLSHALVWDDPLLLDHVRELRQQGGWSALLTAGFRLSEDVDLGYYRPVVLLSLALDDLASTFHPTNVLLHAGCTWLVGMLLWRFGFSPAISLLGATIFALHPVHVESVAFVSGRTDVLAALFVMIATLAWKANRRWLGLGAFALALLSKELALVLPPVLLALDALGFPTRPEREGGWIERNAAWLLGWLAVILAVALLRFVVADVGLGGAGRAAAVRDPSSALWSPAWIPAILATYARLLVVPWPLNGYYTPDQIAPGVTSVLSIVLLLGAAWWARRSPHPRSGAAGLIWIVTFLLPVLGFVPIAGAMVAERFLYVPSIGLSVLICGAAAALARGRGRRALVIGAPLVVIALATGTVLRIPVWKDELSLYSNLVETSPRCVECLENLGIALHEAGRHDEAVEPLRRAIAIRPGAAKAHDMLGIQYGTLGHPLEALPHFLEAIRLRPERVAYRENLGKTLLDLRRFEEAERAFSDAIALDPGLARLRFGRALALVGLGRLEEAERERRALEARAPELARGLSIAIENAR